MPADAFISYSIKDRIVADAVCAALEAGGVRCWIAPRDVPPGEQHDAAVVSALKAARLMVLVFSASSSASQRVRRQLSLASARGIIPVELPGFSFPPADTLPEELRPLERHQRVEYTHRYFRAMVETIVQYLKTAADLSS
ncbi:MAG TPA: toll/interleukin-1 receptor domain-containing protein [Pyrinomonadaceae bacterium]|jgi:hypothetical protein